jgi:hypothetical protein
MVPKCEVGFKLVVGGHESRCRSSDEKLRFVIIFIVRISLLEHTFISKKIIVLGD